MYEETGMEINKTNEIDFVWKKDQQIFHYVTYHIPYMCVNVVIQQSEIVDYGFFTLEEMSHNLDQLNFYTRIYLEFAPKQQKISVFKQENNYRNDEDRIDHFDGITAIIPSKTKSSSLRMDIELPEHNVCGSGFKQRSKLPILYPQLLLSDDENLTEDDELTQIIQETKQRYEQQQENKHFFDSYELGYGSFVNNHLKGSAWYTEHDYDCSYYCTGCYNQNTSAFDELDQLYMEKWIERQYDNFFKRCYCDSVEKCDLHYSPPLSNTSSLDGFEAQILDTRKAYSKKKIPRVEQTEFKPRSKHFSKYASNENVNTEIMFVKKNKTKCNKEQIQPTYHDKVLYCTAIFKYCKHLRHGEKKRVLDQLLAKVKHNLDQTYLRNSREDFLKLVRMLKFYRIKFEWHAGKFEKFISQGFFDFIMPSFVKKGLDLVDKTTRVVDRVDEMV